MRVSNSVLSILFLLSAIHPAYAASTPLEVFRQGAKEKAGISIDKLWFKRVDAYRNKVSEEYGLDFAFLFDYAQQVIAKSSNNRGKTRGTWYWNLEIAKDLWKGAQLFSEFEVDKGKGIDKLLPTFSVLNENGGENAWLYIPALYLEQNLFEDRLFFAVGKTDLSNWFDCNEAANSADTQFLSSSLANNLSIPFPAKGLTGMVSFKPYEWLYLQSGAATARAQSTKTGLSDGFNSAFFINELGLAPKFGSLPGNYRFILRANHERLDYINSDEFETKKNDFGFALSFDQAITSRLTLFLRYGFSDPKVRDIEYFWSGGAQLAEPIPGRKFDILGFGVARSIFGEDFRQANGEDTARSETFYEIYYSYRVNNSLALTPNLQIVTNPNADKTAETAIVLGLKFLLSF